ncbi:MAG: hypothetical protein IJ646_02120 [Clostridia bacterium]|nr:hypothetical protein [Clostridia bacterium]
MAATYQDYLTEREYSIHSVKRLPLPEPEFYVIYTGQRHFESDTISMRDAFWQNPNANLDLIVKVIHTENKSDIIGQYIIFSHVLDAQIKLYGRNRLAVEETIRICQDEDVLKEYLDTRKKEVIDIMITLFDQEYAVKAYVKDMQRISRIEATIEDCKFYGFSKDVALHRIVTKYNIPERQAQEYIDEYWEKHN